MGEGKTKQNQIKPNQTKPLYCTDCRFFSSSCWLARWLAWLAPPAHPAVDGTAEEPEWQRDRAADRRGAAAAERREQQQQQKQQISQSFARHHPSFIPISSDIIHLSW
jgi:hypothetical protein